jgi:urease accessory protein
VIPASTGDGAPPTSLLHLLVWLSPTFPTGGFAYSHGLEWAVECGDVRDEATSREWVADVLRHGAGRTDAILFRHAHAGADVTDLARATQASRERLAESMGQGRAFAAAAAAWSGRDTQADAPYPVAVARLAAQHRIDADLACAALLQAFATNLISAAVRLVPLGQSAGLAALAALQPIALEVAAATRGAALDEIGGCAFRADIAAMRHETQYTRLFRS